MNTKTIVGFVIGVCVLVVVIGVIASSSGSTPSPYDVSALAQCLTNKGVVFYGAFWCPHCQATKKLFGDAVSKLPYVECSTPDAQGVTQICKDQGIESYPTWVFPESTTSSSTRLTGERTLEELASQAGCPLLPNPSLKK